MQAKKRPARCWSTERGKVGTKGVVLVLIIAQGKGKGNAESKVESGYAAGADRLPPEPDRKQGTFTRIPEPAKHGNGYGPAGRMGQQANMRDNAHDAG